MTLEGKELENGVNFKWGRKRGTGGTDKNCQFYDSFTYDGTEYFLYDSIYLYKEGEDPYIGKLAKIWQNNSSKRKMVKVVWFFQPTDIKNWLGETTVHEKELFLACGEGPALSNINLLEVIIGRCKVVCTSKDKRNVQPLHKDLAVADYFFYRTFNVNNFVISENIGDNIAGIAVENFFNKGVDRSGERNKSLLTDKTAEIVTKVDLLREEPFGLGPHSSCGEAVKGSALKIEENDDLPHNTVVEKEKKRAVSFLDENKVSDRPNSNALEQRPLKKSRVMENTTTSKELDLHHNTVVDKERKRVVSILDESKFNDRSISDALEQKPVKKSKLLETATMNEEQDLLRHTKPVEVPRKPIHSEETRRKWFNKKIDWEAKMNEAQKDGTLVLLENLDPSYSHAEVENIMDVYLSEKVQAKMVALTVHSNPFAGQAFVIFNSVDAAKKVLKKLDEGCLMLPNARPLVCRQIAYNPHVQQTKFLGHYTIDKMRRKPQTDDFRNAVSTSHCSQPNTIEYEMAMEWRLIQENFLISLTELFKQQKTEVGRLWSNLKTKY